MYIPGPFEQNDHQRILKMMQENAFATVISSVNDHPFVSHLPLLVEESNTTSESQEIVIRGHLAYANEHWRMLEENPEVMVIFQGPHSYISPSWYENSGIPPTWNYAAIHVKGQARILKNQDELVAVIEQLTQTHESSMDKPWQPDYPVAMLSAIVGFEISVTQIEAKYKLSQNRDRRDILSAIGQLQSSEHENDRAIAKLMQRELES